MVEAAVLFAYVEDQQKPLLIRVLPSVKIFI
jgi:hypothetical protein